MFVDLLFASSGIESEVVASAEDIEIFPNLIVPVATISSLIALKVLSGDNQRRLQDIIDIQHLLVEASQRDIDEARDLLDLITDRGFDRNKNLQADLDRYIDQFKT